jgi:hypothetical protein
MGIFGQKNSLGVLLRLTRQGHALGDEDAHLPFFKWASSMTILPMGIFQSRASADQDGQALSFPGNVRITIMTVR